MYQCSNFINSCAFEVSRLEANTSVVLNTHPACYCWNANFINIENTNVVMNCAPLLVVSQFDLYFFLSLLKNHICLIFCYSFTHKAENIVTLDINNFSCSECK